MTPEYASFEAYPPHESRLKANVDDKLAVPPHPRYSEVSERPYSERATVGATQLSVQPAYSTAYSTAYPSVQTAMQPSYFKLNRTPS